MIATILMYHAVLPPDGGTADWDPHYAVTAAGFRAQLAALHAAGFVAASVASLMATAGAQRSGPARPVALTFDDGTATDRDVALQLLVDARATADFFVNPSRVGMRGTVSWQGLAEMQQAGMSIQSHAHTHRMLDELSAVEVHDELRRSKQTIEDRLGSAVTLLAPPGGRCTTTVLDTARSLGYSLVCGSQPGVWQGPAQFLAPRLAVLAATTTARLQSWALGRRRSLLREQARFAATGTAKRILGNVGYERLRARVLGQVAPR